MPSSNLIRLGGLAAVIAGVLLIIGELLYLIVGLNPGPEDLSTPSSVFQSVLFVIGFIFLLGGLVGLYAVWAEELGALGFAGFLGAFLGTASFVGVGWLNAFAVPSLAEETPRLLEVAPPPLVFVSAIVSSVLFSLGWLLLGLAALRARAYPRWTTVLLMVGAVLAFVSLPFTFVPFGAAVAWMGLTLPSEASGSRVASPSQEAAESRARVR